MTGEAGSAQPNNPASNGGIEAALAALTSKRAGAADTPPAKQEPTKRKEPADNPKAKAEEPDEAQRADDEAEPEVEETEEEADAEAPEDDDEDGTDEFVQLKDGSQVPLSEVVDGYMRRADYTQKTQALAEERRGIEAERGKAKEAQQQFLDRARQYDDALKAFSGVLDTEGERFKDFWADYRKLKASDPDAAEEFKVSRDEWLEKKQTIDAERKRRADESEAEAKAQAKEAQERLAKTILSEFPQWQDKAVANADWAKMESVAAKLGYSQAEIAASSDPRAYVMLYWAAQGLNARSKVESAKRGDLQPKTAKEQKIRVLRPKASRPSGSTVRRSALAETEATARKSGSIDDVFAVMQARRAASARQ